MKQIKYILTFITLAGLLSFAPAAHAPAVRGIKWVVLNNCLVKVNGSTNVNKFSCEIDNYPSRDTLVCYQNGTSDQVKLAGKLELAVFDFDCLDKLITRDLRETLKAKDHPSLHITLVSLQHYPALNTSREQIAATVAIELAGINREMNFNLSIFGEDAKWVHLNGSKNIRFSDFGLTPPRKMGGIIKAKDDLTVSFQLNFKVID